MNVPIRETNNAVCEGRLLMQPFQDRYIGIIALFILVNSSICKAGKNFVEAWIREFFAIGQFGNAAFVRVAIKLTFFRNRFPKKGQQGAASLFRSGPKKSRVQPIGVIYSIFFVDERRFRASKDLLPAETIDADQKNILGGVSGGKN